MKKSTEEFLNVGSAVVGVFILYLIWGIGHTGYSEVPVEDYLYFILFAGGMVYWWLSKPPEK